MSTPHPPEISTVLRFYTGLLWSTKAFLPIGNIARAMLCELIGFSKGLFWLS